MIHKKRSVISYTGSHGTGKSTGAGRYYEFMKESKTNLAVSFSADIEAMCPYPINKQTTEQAQAWIFAAQLKHEFDAMSRFDVVITDRTIIDTIAYSLVAGFTSQAQAMLSYAEHHIQHYDLIIFKKIFLNPYLYPDGIRETEDLKFRQDVEDTLLSLYDQLIEAGVLGADTLTFE
jgi:hypothetical protein